MKQAKLKLVDGGAKSPSPPEPKAESYWDYSWMFAVSGIVWLVIGYWIYGFLFH
jgi:hypothetical protein